MSSLSKPYTFAAGAFAVGSQVNSDFDTLYNWVNANAIWADGSVAFTGVPSGPNVDPSANNHLTRKSYVDAKFPNSGSVRAQNFNVTTDGTGAFTVTYSVAFPTATIAVLLQIAQSNVPTLQAVTAQGTWTATGFQGRIVAANGGAQPTGTYEIAYIAVGY